MKIDTIMPPCHLALNHLLIIMVNIEKFTQSLFSCCTKERPISKSNFFKFVLSFRVHEIKSRVISDYWLYLFKTRDKLFHSIVNKYVNDFLGDHNFCVQFSNIILYLDNLDILFTKLPEADAGRYDIFLANHFTHEADCVGPVIQSQWQILWHRLGNQTLIFACKTSVLAP